MAATVPVVAAPALRSHHGRLMLVYALLALAILIVPSSAPVIHPRRPDSPILDGPSTPDPKGPEPHL